MTSRDKSIFHGDPYLDRDVNPSTTTHEVSLSLKEIHLLQRLRQLDRGSHTIFLIKTQSGRDGIHSFIVEPDSVSDGDV